MSWLARLAALAQSAGVPVAVVGGAVRDRLLGRPSPDVDVCCRGALDLAAAFARSERAFLVVLDAARGTARVIPRDRAGWLDFAEQQGELTDDLRQRDFTLNAVACPLTDFVAGTPAWIDPTGGVADLAARTLRACGDTALQDDPLRCLRAYRLAAQLELTVEPRTAALVRAAAPELPRVAAERVLQEWLPLLAADGAVAAVAALDRDQVLPILLPASPPGAAAAVACLEPLLALLRERFAAWLGEAEHLALLRFAVLVGPSETSPEAELVRRFALSRDQRRVLAALRPVTVEPAAEPLADLVLDRGEAAPGALAVATAWGRLERDALAAALDCLAQRLLPAWRSAPLVTGRDLETVLGLAPGRRFGPLLHAARRAQLTGRATTRESALAVVREELQSDG